MIHIKYHQYIDVKHYNVLVQFVLEALFQEPLQNQL